MKLYEYNETAFSNDGFGSLSDASDATVKQAINDEFELEFMYPVNGIHYSDIKYGRIVKAKPNPYDREQYFRIYKVSRPINGTVTVNAEHISYDLNGIIINPARVNPYYINSAADMVSYLNDAGNYATASNFSFSTNVTTAGQMELRVPQNVRELLGGGEGSMLDIYGGEFAFDNFNVSLLSNRGKDRGITIRYGKNLTDFKQEESIEKMATGIYPFSNTEEYGRVLGDIISTGATGRPKIQMLDCSQVKSDTWVAMGYSTGTDDKGKVVYAAAPTVTMLDDYANRYIVKENIGVPEINLTVSFVDLAKVDSEMAAELSHVELGDTVTIIFPELLDKEAKAECISYEYDVLSDRYTNIQLGSKKQTISDTIAGNINVINSVNTSVNGLDIRLEATENGLESEVSRAKGTENELSSKITQTETEIKQEVTDRRNDVSSSIDQLASSITLSVNNGEKSSTIQISCEKDDGSVITAQAETIKFTGNVVFESDLEDGTTSIDGSCIKTGKISAERIDASDITAKKLQTDTSYDFGQVIIENGVISSNGMDGPWLDGLRVGGNTKFYGDVYLSYTGGANTIYLGSQGDIHCGSAYKSNKAMTVSISKLTDILENISKRFAALES